MSAYWKLMFFSLTSVQFIPMCSFALWTHGYELNWGLGKFAVTFCVFYYIYIFSFIYYNCVFISDFRAAQKLNISSRKKKKAQSEMDLPPFPTNFSEVIRCTPPPAPPGLLRGVGRAQNPGTGKVRHIYYSIFLSQIFSVLKQILLVIWEICRMCHGEF